MSTRPSFYSLIILAVLISMFPAPRVWAQPEVLPSGTPLVQTVPVGGILPITVKLINFGSSRRVDVTVTYVVFDAQQAVVLSLSDTVAVETTLSFVKELVMPESLEPGEYTAHVSLAYGAQEFPASSEFSFTIEQTIMGIPQSRFVLYALGVIVLGGGIGGIARFIVAQRRRSRLAPHEYRSIPEQERPFYEMISDIIMQMRYKAGDHAIALAGGVAGLTIDPYNGKITSLSGDPAKIASDLIAAYRKELGIPINFAMTPHGTQPPDGTRSSVLIRPTESRVT